MKTIFTKYSNERCPLFCIKTNIVKTEDNTLQVQKSPYTDLAIEHISNMLASCEKINKYYGAGGFRAANSFAIKNGVAFEYIKGITLDEKLELAYETGDISLLLDIINNFKSSLMQCKTVKPFVSSPAFEEVFGAHHLPTDLFAMDFTCLDLAFGNIIENAEGMNIIDYEWCFDFAIPIEFLVYRAVNLFVVINGKTDLLEKDIYGFLGFTPQIRAVFDSMEKSFQGYVTKNAFSTRDLYENFGNKNHTLHDILTANTSDEANCYSQVYIDYGNGYSEDNSYRRAFKYGQWLDINITLSSKAVACRFDPEDNSCIMLIRGINAFNNNGMYSPEYTSNGCQSQDAIYFNNSDPQIMFSNIKSGTTALQISCCIIPMDIKNIEALAKAVFDNHEKGLEIARLNDVISTRDNTIAQLKSDLEITTSNFNSTEQNLLANINNLNAVITNQKEYITAIENSKGWKLICRLRKLLGK